MNHHPVSKWLLMMLASIVALTPLAIDLYLPAMVTIADAFQAPLDLVQISLSCYLGGYALGMLIFGPLADRFSRQKLVSFGLLGFGLVSLAITFTDNIWVFCGLRTLQAFLGAAATVIVPGVIRHHYQENTAKGMSYVSMIMMLAPLVAPSVGAFILLYFEWEMIFWVLSGYAFLLLCLLNTVSVTIPIHFKDRINLAYFLKNYADVLGEPKARYDILSSMFVSFAFFCFLTSVPFIYLEYYNVSEQLFGIVFAFNVIALMMGNFINTRAVPKYGSKAMLRFGLFIGLIFGSSVLVISLFFSNLWLLAIAVAPLMMSLGIIASNADALILLKFEKQSGTATAVIGTLRFGIGALAGPILALISPQSATPFASLMLLAVIATAICQRLERHKSIR